MPWTPRTAHSTFRHRRDRIAAEKAAEVVAEILGAGVAAWGILVQDTSGRSFPGRAEPLDCDAMGWSSLRAWSPPSAGWAAGAPKGRRGTHRRLLSRSPATRRNQFAEMEGGAIGIRRRRNCHIRTTVPCRHSRSGRAGETASGRTGGLPKVVGRGACRTPFDVQVQVMCVASSRCPTSSAA